MQNVVLTILLLASHQHNITQRCMESIRPILARIPSELIVMDTIAEKADAINEELEHAKGEWFMIVDAATCVKDATKIIEFFKSGSYKNYKGGIYKNYDIGQEQFVNSTNFTVFEDKLSFAKAYLEWLDRKELPATEETVFMVSRDMMQSCTKEACSEVLFQGAVTANRKERYEEALRIWECMPGMNEQFQGTPYAKEWWITVAGVEQQTGQECFIVNGKAVFRKLIKSDIKLTVGILVSNNIQYIEKAMQGLKPLLDAVPSELIAVDTKGEESDGSIDIVRKYTDKIYPFSWCNDFSAARNVCLEHARGEWFLYQDDDECFENVQELIDFFNSGECNNFYGGYYIARNYLATGGYSEGVVGRMIRRMETTKFVGRIHEVFNEVFSPIKQFSCFVHHYGYIYKNEEESLAKLKRNVDIMREEIKEKGLDPHMALQMAQSYLGRKNMAEEGYRLCMEYIPILEQQGMLLDSNSQWLLVASVRYFIEISYEKLLEQANRIQQYPLTETSKAIVSAVIVLSAIVEEDYETVIKYANLYLKNYNWCKENVEKATEQAQLDSILFFSEDYYYRVLRAAKIAKNCLEERKQGMRFSEYNRIKELGASLEEAFAYINTSGDVQLLGDCTEALQSIVESLARNKDSIESEEVFVLANKLSEALQSAMTGAFAYDELNNLLGRLFEVCEMSIKRRYKLLFVADIKGKWDSMSSVYEAAKNRPDCDVNVVLQPVFRMTTLPNGERRTEVKYDDYLTPMGISHISYDEYKMEEELPDITFICQPYESATTQMFWPANIAKYSKMVYLPYYTALTLNSEIFPSRDAFLYMQAEKYAWKIACQSDKMKEYYSQIGVMRGKNVVASGLPKWDEVVNLDKTKVMYPEGWKEKLSGKKVFIWNTHFNVRQKGSDILETGLEFIKLFQERKDIALIWRPHPMTETVIKTYAPESYSVVLEMKRIISDSENMVMDEEASYLPAFSCSDALISDVSSMIDLYLHMDKPVLMLPDVKFRNVKNAYYTIDGLWDFTKVPQASTMEEQKEFIDAVVRGEDNGRENREYLKNTYLSLADGRCGERFLNSILKDYADEMDATESDIYIEPEQTIVIGTLEDSLPCLEQLKRNGSEVWFCEEFLGEDGSGEYPVVSLENIPKDFSGLLVITTRNMAFDIRNYISENYGICSDRMVPFWNLYYAGVPHMVCDRIMQNPNNHNYDGLILGISHTEVGIVKEKLKGNFCNLSVSSQDLYFQCKTLEHCVERYYEKIKNLKVAIIDLYDYHYFNYNTSASKSAWKYLRYGGYNLDPHDFNNNRLAGISFEDMLKRLENERTEGLSEMDFMIWQQFFGDAYECANYEGFNSNYNSLKNRMKIVTKQEIDSYEYDRAIVSKLYPETINENVGCLKKIIQILRLINPDIRIYTVIVPKYIETEALDACGLKNHEGYFNRMIAALQEEFKFTHLDFKKISDISSCKNLYLDAAHLNYMGALKLTKQLNEIIFNE